MAIQALSSADRRRLARDVGHDLVQTHGKRKHYAVEEVKAAARRRNIPLDWDCWAFALYVRRREFVDYHRAIGEPCDYEAMREKMIEAVATDVAAAPEGGAGLEGSRSSTEVGSSWFSDLLEWAGFDSDSGDLP